jgi:hypothetical protein
VPTSGKREERKLRAALMAAAYDLLGRVGETPPGPVTAAASDEVATVTITVTPTGRPSGKPAPLSPIERAIVEALGSSTLVGKQIAAKAGYAYNSQFRLILANLCDRGTLQKTEQGYRVSDTV